MDHSAFPTIVLFILSLSLSGCQVGPASPPQGSIHVRVATYNIEDVRSEDLVRPSHPRLLRIAQEIRELRPDIILLNEIAFDRPAPADGTAGLNAQRFIDAYLSREGNSDSSAVRYSAIMPPPNTGLLSGFDLDRNGETVSTTPVLPSGSGDGKAGPQTPEGRAYGGDSWGFGMFPGQYGFAVLVSTRFEILQDEVRTFQNFRWSSLPDPLRPIDPITGESWYDDATWQVFRLSSKTHVDVPVRLDSETVLHILASHPTPPAFDGQEGRNKRRNHDEIRFWNYYLDDAEFLIDDQGRTGGLDRNDYFVIVGDLNADPDEGDSIDDPIGTFLFNHDRVNGDFVPVADAEIEGLDSDDTARWGLRVDYVLPSTNIVVKRGGVHRHSFSADEAPSDHFPVWLDLELPSASHARLCGNTARRRPFFSYPISISGNCLMTRELVSSRSLVTPISPCLTARFTRRGSLEVETCPSFLTRSSLSPWRDSTLQEVISGLGLHSST